VAVETELSGDKAVMPLEVQSRPLILLIEDTDETRQPLEKILKKRRLTEQIWPGKKTLF